MAIFLICLASSLTAFYIAAPFWRVRREQNSPRSAASRAKLHRQTALNALQARRDGLLREIKDLEFDRRMGKIERDEHDAQRAELAAQAKAVLRQIEALNAGKSARQAAPEQTAPRIATPNLNLDLEIESEILIARARQRRSQNESQAARWDCECGRAMKISDAFCGSCGAPRPREIAVATA